MTYETTLTRTRERAAQLYAQIDGPVSGNLPAIEYGAARLLAAIALAPDPKPTREGRTTQQVADLAKITYRMLDFWATQGHLGPMPPTGTGNPRNWSDQQTRRAVIMAALVHNGLTIPAAARHAPNALDGPWTEIGLPGLDLKIHTQRILQRAGLWTEPDMSDIRSTSDPMTPA